MKKKNINLYTVTPYWYFFVYPSFVLFILLPGSFILNSVVLFAGLILLKAPQKINTYRKLIIKIWLASLPSIIICAVILWATVEIQVIARFACFFRPTVIFIPGFGNYYPSLYGLIEFLVIAAPTAILNYRFSFNNIEISKRGRILFSLSLAVFTSPHQFLNSYTSIYHLLEPFLHEFNQLIPPFFLMHTI